VIVLRVQHEVNGNNGSADCDHGQNGVDQKHEAVDVVEFVGPKRSEYEVHLYEDRTKRQNARHRDDERGTTVPGRHRDGSRDAVHSAWRLVLVHPVATENRARYGKWKSNKRPDSYHLYNNREGDSADSVIVDSNAVEEGSDHHHN